jgi:hypothetical protein
LAGGDWRWKPPNRKSNSPSARAGRGSAMSMAANNAANAASCQDNGLMRRACMTKASSKKIQDRMTKMLAARESVEFANMAKKS